MAKKITLKEVGQMLEHVIKHMATKQDITDLAITYIIPQGEQLASIEAELKTLRAELGKLTNQVANIVGYRKEIDNALERIAKIEKHLGINKKIAA